MKKSILQLMAISFISIVLTLSLASSYDPYYDNKIRLNSNSLNQYKYDTDNKYYGYMNDYYNNYYRPKTYYSDYDDAFYVKQRNYYRPYYYQPIFSRPITRSFGHGNQIVRVRVDNYYNRNYDYYDNFDDYILLNPYYYSSPKVKTYYADDVIYLGYKKEVTNGIPRYYK